MDFYQEAENCTCSLTNTLGFVFFFFFFFLGPSWPVLTSKLFWFILDSVEFWILDSDYTLLGHCIMHLDKEFNLCLFTVILDVKRFILMLASLPKAPKIRNHPAFHTALWTESWPRSTSYFNFCNRFAQGTKRFLHLENMTRKSLSWREHASSRITENIVPLLPECLGVWMWQWSPLKPYCALTVTSEACFPFVLYLKYLLVSLLCLSLSLL